LSCLVKDLRVKVESGVNKRKGLSIELRPPSDIPEDVWVKTHGEGTILEDVYILYRSKVNPEDTWEVTIQAIKLKDGCVGLRIIHFKKGKIVRQPMVNYQWLLEDLKPEIDKTTIIKNLLKKIIC